MIVRRAAVCAFVATLVVACGADVDLGGSLDAGARDVEVDARDTCGSLSAPTVSAPCRACTPSSSGCQANGCYGGYWCYVPTRDCEPPPDACP